MQDLDKLLKIKRAAAIYLSLILIFILLLINYLYNQSKQEVLAALDSRLIEAAEILPYVLPENYHEKISDSDSVSIKEEHEISKKLYYFAKKSHIQNIYSLIQKDGIMFYTSPISKNESKEIESSRWVFPPYQSSSNKYTEILKTGKTAVFNNVNQWGNYRTAVVRKITSSNKKWLSCADFPLNKINSRVNSLFIKRGIIVVILFLILLPYIILTFKSLNKCTMRSLLLKKNDEKHTLEIEEYIVDLENLQRQLLLALSSGEMSIFKWKFKEKIIEITRPNKHNRFKIKNNKLRIEKLKKLIHPDDEARVSKQLALYISGCSDAFSEEFRARFHSNDRYYSVTGKIFEKNNSGVGKSMVGTIKDITNVRLAELETQRNQKLEAIGHLAGGIAHDFNNMLQAISGYADMIKMSLDEDDENIEIIDLLLQAANKSKTLVGQLLTFSRMGKEKSDSIDIRKLLSEMGNILNPLLGENIKLNISLSDYIPYVSVNRVQLEQAIMNLCINARDEMPDGGKISISADEQTISTSFCVDNKWAKPGTYARITVTDTGPGIPENISKHIFEPFFTTKEVGKGTGLGLSVVYSVIQKASGFINLKTAIGKGTTFELYIPASEIIEELKVRANDEIKSELTGDECVLLAEDTDLVRNFICKILRKSGYEVLPAKDGKEAVELFKKHQSKIDILVFDIRMPNLSGKEAYEEITKIRTNIPVIFCSGYHEEILDTDFYINFSGAFLPKPYKNHELLKKMRSLLDEDKQEQI